MDSVGEGEGGKIWENGIETCILSCMKRVASPKHPASCIEPGLATHFIYYIIHISMPFSQITPPSSSPTESKRLFYTSVSLLLSRTQGYCYHLSKFHIHALVYCTGVFLSGLLHLFCKPVAQFLPNRKVTCKHLVDSPTLPFYAIIPYYCLLERKI